MHLVHYRMGFVNYLAAAGLALSLSACGGGSSGSDTGSLSVGVTDLPVTEDVKVCVHFTGITLHHSDGDLIDIPYDPRMYDDAADCTYNQPFGESGSENNTVALSALQGELSVQLVNAERVKAGRYNWIRLDFDESLSYVIDSGGKQDLSCSSCDGESGLKLNRGIVVPAGGEANIMFDVELAKALNKQPSGDYKLRPTLRLVDLSETGKVTGTVAASLIPRMVSDTDTGCKVYVYAGHDVIPDDYHDADNVLTSAKVLYDSTSMTYEYVAAFLPTDSTAGPTLYTVALTCDADDIDIDQNNDAANPTGNDVIFTDETRSAQNVDVVTDQTTSVHFPPVSPEN